MSEKKLAEINPETGRPYWGDSMRAELQAAIDGCVKHAEFVKWMLAIIGMIVGASFFVARLPAEKAAAKADFASKVADVARQENLETRKDIRSLRWEQRTGKTSSRLEQPLPAAPPPVSADAAE